MYCGQIKSVMVVNKTLYGSLHEQARLTKSRALIGYLSGQDGAILVAQNYCCNPQEKSSQKLYNKYFIDQACLLKVCVDQEFKRKKQMKHHQQQCSATLIKVRNLNS